MQTDELIKRLSMDAHPVRRLRPPMLRMMTWFALSLPWVAAIVFVMGLRVDLGERMHDARWLLEQGAAFATAFMAAAAAFCAGVPGRPKWEHFLPLLPLAVWLGTLGQGCVEAVLSADASGVRFHADWQCLPGIVMVGFGPAVIMVVMILRGSPIAPMTTTALGALAAGALAEVGLRFFHRQDASLMVLVWQAGTVFGLTLLAGVFGRTILRWRYAGAQQT